MRGQYSIFNDIIGPDTSLSVPRERKGRNELLMQKRNDLLIHRYYYHIKIQERQYLRTLHILEHDEMFIAERTIIDIISRCGDQLRNLHERKPGLNYFRKKYPMWVW